MAHRHSDVANIDMIGRMIRAAGKRVAGYDPDQLRRLSDLRAELDAALLEAVAGQRSQGITWASIGEAMGVTGEACIMRFGPKIAAAQGVS